MPEISYLLWYDNLEVLHRLPHIDLVEVEIIHLIELDDDLVECSHEMLQLQRVMPREHW